MMPTVIPLVDIDPAAGMTGGGAAPGAPVLEARDVRVRFALARDWRGRAVRHAHALNGVSLQVRRGEAFGIVGESGCGKSTLAAVLMGLLGPSEGELRRLPRADGRPADVQIVFQDPQSSLDPRLPAWRVIVEPLAAAGQAGRRGRGRAPGVGQGGPAQAGRCAGPASGPAARAPGPLCA